MTPVRYFYLVDIETGRPLAIYPADDAASRIELHTLEGRLRAELGVDDVERGIALWDSELRPLSPEVLAATFGNK